MRLLSVLLPTPGSSLATQVLTGIRHFWVDSKEITDANIEFFNTYRAKSSPSGAMPRFQVVPGHNHISNVLSIGTEDDLQGKMLVDFIREVTA